MELRRGVSGDFLRIWSLILADRRRRSYLTYRNRQQTDRFSMFFVPEYKLRIPAPEQALPGRDAPLPVENRKSVV